MIYYFLKGTQQVDLLVFGFLLPLVALPSVSLASLLLRIALIAGLVRSLREGGVVDRRETQTVLETGHNR